MKMPGSQFLNLYSVCLPTHTSNLTWAKSFCLERFHDSEARRGVSLIKDYDDCLTLGFPKHHDQRKLGEERICSILLFQVTVRHWGKAGQKPGRGSWRRDHGGVLLMDFLSLVCSACFLTAPGITVQGSSHPQRTEHSHMGHQSNAPQANLSWGSLFPNNSRLFWDEIELLQGSSPETTTLTIFF